MKDKEWLKEEIEKIDVETSENFPHYDVISKNVVLYAIDQLDEPEALSQKRIDDNIFEVDSWNKVVNVIQLKNLLVPKQELPVIPQWVADNIESKKRVGTRLNVAMSEFPEFRLERELDIDEHECNEIYARAWLDGYTVEKEPLYRARLKVITDEFIASYLRTQSSDAEDRLKALEIGSKYINEDYRHLSEFTEDELKRLDIWVSEQWEIEELEE